jgi:hypothetical protein
MPLDPDLSISTPPTPVAVTMIGGTGDGAISKEKILATTPEQHANLLITVVSPLMALLIRFINSYLTILVGLVAAGMSSDVIPAKDFGDLVLRCAGLSLAGAGLGALKDLVTIFGKLESKFPLLTGNV